jgi:hypothetical protein
MKLILFFLAFSLQAQTIYTLCASGCDYTDLTTAITAHPNDSIFELRAGETFDGLTTFITNRNVTIRSSRWKELPSPGIGVTPSHASLMPTLRTINAEYVVVVGSWEAVVALNGINTTTDVISTEYVPLTSQLADGVAVTCRVRTNVDTPGSLPSPLVQGTIYYVRDYTNYTFKLAATPGGAAINLTSTGSAAESYYSRPTCNRWSQPSNILFQGVRFTQSSSADSFALIRVGNNDELYPELQGPKGIQFVHCIVTGAIYEQGPSNGFLIYGGTRISARDSWIGHIKSFNQVESHGFAIVNTVGLDIVNNYIMAASINILSAGADAASYQVNKNVNITNNFIEKVGYLMYKSGSGAPSGECYYGGGSGAFYRDTAPSPNTCANGACYECQANNTWAQNTSATYRSDNYFTKNLLEFKDCENCTVEGNKFVGQYVGPDGGQDGAWGTVAGVGLGGFGSPYHKTWSTTWKNNHTDYSYGGIFISNAKVYPSDQFTQIPLRDIVVKNNIFTNLGRYPMLSQWPNATDVNRYALKHSGGNEGFQFLNNTFRGVTGHWGMTVFAGAWVPATLIDSQYSNNLFPLVSSTTFFVDNATQDCVAGGLFNYIASDGYKHFRSSVYPFASTPFLGGTNCTSTITQNIGAPTSVATIDYASSSDSRLNATSPYSSSNATPTFVGTNSGDVGADVDLVEQQTIPAAARTWPYKRVLNVSLIPGTTTTQLRFLSPDGVSCTVVLYTGGYRSSLNINADTNSGPNQAYNRASSTVSGNKVTFNFGAVAALAANTLYSYKLTCGSIWYADSFVTKR